jgi:hypothetical protein
MKPTMQQREDLRSLKRGSCSRAKGYSIAYLFVFYFLRKKERKREIDFEILF